VFEKTRNRIAKAFMPVSIQQGQKINTQYSNEQGTMPISPDQNQRGIQVYYMSSLSGVTGKNKQGNIQTSRVENPYFYLTIPQRNEIFRLCSPVFGVVTSRMNRISALNYTVKPVKETDEQIAEDLKSQKEIYDEYSDVIDYGHMLIRAKAFNKIKEYIPEIKPDLSNFSSALLRWKKNFQRVTQTKAEEIQDWLAEPNQGITWSQFVKKWVYDIHIHGDCAVYKQSQNERLVNFDTLIGGTTFKLKHPYFTNMEGYVQIVSGFEPRIYYGDEISFSQYAPTSVRTNSMIPLEALINKVAESLLFDELMAQRADGTRPPEKAVVITKNSPFGSMDNTDAENIPLEAGEQARIEEKLRTPVKEGVITFSGNQATVVDLSRADTITAQVQRQKDIREEVALVFCMSNMEVNLTGGDSTSGRSTSESQAEIEQGKGIAPHIKQLEEKVTKDLIFARYGYGYKLEIERQKNELDERTLDKLKLDTGELTQNELREKYNKSVFVGDEFNKPKGGQAEAPGSDATNPLFSRQI